MVIWKAKKGLIGAGAPPIMEWCQTLMKVAEINLLRSFPLRYRSA